MRRRISLYIADNRVDLTDDSFILFNYTMEDMANPTIVRNSYSQQITLKGTANNNRIFGHIWKADRLTNYGSSQAGIDFDPTQKTPFTIYDEMNEILESGYCKLDSISRSRGIIEYKVSLYGGLGAFLFALSYDSAGNKRTLADLKFTGSSAAATELDFTINATAVTDAWKRLGGDTSKPALWDILNFAPAYNGLPGGSFDADKAMVNAVTAGLQVPAGYSTNRNWVIATLPKKYTEWEAKDLRSYLQRPVIKVSKVIDAICQSYNNGGYQVDLDADFFKAANPYYSKTWLTLPLIDSLNLDIDEGGGNISPVTGAYILPDGGDINVNYKVDLAIVPQLSFAGTTPLVSYLHCHDTSDPDLGVVDIVNYITYTISGYDENNNLLQEVVVRASTSASLADFPYYGRPTIDFIGDYFSNGVWHSDPIRVTLEAQGLKWINITRQVTCQRTGSEGTTADAFGNPAQYSTKQTISAYSETYPVGQNTESYSSSSTARTGATITKALLLSSDRTPADYLLSYCKTFGLVILCDKSTKKVTILTRQNFYRNNIIDLTGRISQEGITGQPFSFDCKWYDFALPYANGEYAKYYASIYNRIFGIQRVNTGYDFNADSRDLLDGIVFRGACEVLENSKYFCDIVDGSHKIPAVFQDAGGTYTLYDSTGKAEEFALPGVSPSARKTWWNDINPTFDFISRVQFHNAQDAGYEERDTLLFLREVMDITGITARIAVTDDSATMMALNDNTPCWILDYQQSVNGAKVTDLPIFSRYVWDDDEVTDSLDFGTPMEVAIPDVTFASDSSIYAKFWQSYIGDRYDDDSRVVTCKVNLSGYQVNEDLLRSFYYFDGCVWALNRIVNHSLSTWDDTECEFIKVQDKDNYLD